jgi:hypothetical protein
MANNTKIRKEIEKYISTYSFCSIERLKKKDLFDDESFSCDHLRMICDFIMKKVKKHDFTSIRSPKDLLNHIKEIAIKVSLDPLKDLDQKSVNVILVDLIHFIADKLNITDCEFDVEKNH